MNTHYIHRVVFRIKQTQNSCIFIGDTPKDFAILQIEPKLQQVLGEFEKC